MESKDLICINCPIGCMLNVTLEGKDILEVRGNTCKHGVKYAHKELTNPTRIVTSTVPVLHGSQTIISVKTEKDIPKDKIFACMQELKNITAIAPVQIGDIICKNIADTGINIIATKESMAI